MTTTTIAPNFPLMAKLDREDYTRFRSTLARTLKTSLLNGQNPFYHGRGFSPEVVEKAEDDFEALFQEPEPTFGTFGKAQQAVREFYALMAHTYAHINLLTVHSWVHEIVPTFTQQQLQAARGLFQAVLASATTRSF